MSFSLLRLLLCLLSITAICLPTRALTFTEGFESDSNWQLFEEIVNGSACYDSTIGTAARTTDMVRSGSWGFSTWANKQRWYKTNHVIAYKKISSRPLDGLTHYQLWFRTDSNPADGQSGPEFSIQGTVDTALDYRVLIVGIQHAWGTDSWHVWDSGAWVRFMNLPIETGTWYLLQLRVDFVTESYHWLKIQGGSIDTTINLSSYRIKRETRGWAEEAVVISVENENRYTACTTDSDFRCLYDDLLYYTIPHTWYVNDAIRSGDSWCTEIGYDTADGLTPATPIRSLSLLSYRLRTGDTVLIDAGSYADTLFISNDFVTIRGVDSTVAGTVLDFNDSSAGTGQPSVFAVNCTSVAIRDLRIRNSNRGIEFQNVDQSRIDSVTVEYTGLRALYLQGGSDTNEITNCHLRNNGGHALAVYLSHGNRLISNKSTDNAWNGFSLNLSHGNTLDSNSSLNDGWFGFGLQSQGRGNLLRGNRAWSGDYAFYLETSSLNNFHGNIAETCNNGFYLLSSDSNTFTGNTSRFNTRDGFFFSNSDANRLTTNLSESNVQAGIRLTLGSAGNLLLGNGISGNDTGIQTSNSSGNYSAQNVLSGNAGYQVEISGSSSDDTFQRNVIRPGSANADSAVLVSAATGFTFTRNWWDTACSTSIRARIAGAGASLISYTPFRLRTIDTEIGRDTIAPEEVVITGTDTSYGRVRVHFTTPPRNEDSHAGAVSIQDFRVYRSLLSAPPCWGVPLAILPADSTFFIDTTVAAGIRYYYSITASDGAVNTNESFHSNIDSGLTSRLTGDFSGNSAVDLNDVMLILPHFRSPSAYDLLFDINSGGANGLIDFEDMAELGRRYGL